jgi:hypothetical protein
MPNTAFLHIETDDLPTARVIPLVGAVARVGRGAQCEVCLEEAGLAEVECTLKRRGPFWQLQPVARSGRVSIEGRPLQGPRILAAGVPVRVGRHRLTLERDQAEREGPGSFESPIMLDTEAHTERGTEADAPAPGPDLGSETHEPVGAAPAQSEQGGKAQRSVTGRLAPSARIAVKPLTERRAAATSHEQVRAYARSLRSHEAEREWADRWRNVAAHLRAQRAATVPQASKIAEAPAPPTAAPPRLPTVSDLAGFKAEWRSVPQGDEEPPTSPRPPVPSRPRITPLTPKVDPPRWSDRPIACPPATAPHPIPTVDPEPAPPHPTPKLSTTTPRSGARGPLTAASIDALRPELQSPVARRAGPAQANPTGVPESPGSAPEVSRRPPDHDIERLPTIPSPAASQEDEPAAARPPAGKSRGREWHRSIIPVSNAPPSRRSRVLPVEIVRRAEGALEPAVSRPNDDLDRHWPSARDILAPRRPRSLVPLPAPERSRSARSTAATRPLPTVTRPPEQWKLSLGALWSLTVIASLVLGLAGFVLACLWAAEGSAASPIADRVLRAPGRPGLQTESLPQIQSEPSAAWWRTTSRHLFLHALAKERGSQNAENAEQVDFLLHAARNASPLNPSVQYGQAQHRRAAGPAIALNERFSLSRDVVSQTLLGHRLLEAGKIAEALRVYSDALNAAVRAHLVDLDLPSFRDDADHPRYRLPAQDLIDPIVDRLADQNNVPFSEWRSALPAGPLVHLAAAEALRRHRRADEANQALGFALDQAGEPRPAGCFSALHEAACAEAFAFKEHWSEAVAHYRQAIELADVDAIRRSWWFNLADLYLRLDDDAHKRLAWEYAKCALPNDEITERTMALQKKAGLPFGVPSRTTGDRNPRPSARSAPLDRAPASTEAPQPLVNPDRESVPGPAAAAPGRPPAEVVVVEMPKAQGKARSLTAVATSFQQPRAVAQESALESESQLSEPGGVEEDPLAALPDRPRIDVRRLRTWKAQAR